MNTNDDPVEFEYAAPLAALDSVRLAPESTCATPDSARGGM